MYFARYQRKRLSPNTRNILRTKWIEAKWTSLKGPKQRTRFTGFTTEVIQHEMAHLDEILI